MSHRGAAAQLDRGGGLHVAPADGVPGRVADRHFVVWGREFEERRSESAVAVKKSDFILATGPTDAVHLLGVDSAQDLRLP